MIKSTLKPLPKSGAELEVIINKTLIKEEYDKLYAQAKNELEVPGFRKGKAPEKIAKEKIDASKVYEQAAKILIPKAYQEAVKQNNIFPVSTPKINVKSAKNDNDWVLVIQVALKPAIKLGDYKNKIKELKKSKVKIWTPKEKEDSGKNDQNKNKISLDEIIKTLMDSVTIEVSDILIEDETNRLLTNLIDQTKKLGMTIDQYAQAKGKTVEDIRNEFTKEAERNLIIEFAISEIANSEKITVDEKDIEELINKAQNPDEKERLKKDTYYIAHLLRQQKTLDFLYNL